MAYNARARALRQCTAKKADGSPCRAWAVWGDDRQLCNAHAGRTRGKDRHFWRYVEPHPRTIAVCRCPAYPYPHRASGGLCRWPDAPEFCAGMKSTYRKTRTPAWIKAIFRGGLPPIPKRWVHVPTPAPSDNEPIPIPRRRPSLWVRLWKIEAELKKRQSPAVVEG